MNLLDVNVLVALYRPEHSHHELARSWWERSSEAGTPFTVPDVVWVGFVRIVTNRRIFPVPATLGEAFEFLRKVTEQPRYLTYAPHSEVLGEFVRVGTAAGASADLVTDAYIAATTKALGATLVTFDRDFRRFDGLNVTELA